MENASKALIIAGAILLAIVIISLGLIVVNNTRETINNSNLSEQEIQNFNAKFTEYEGANVSASRVNSLIQLVIATNQTIANEGNNNFVSIVFPSISLANETSDKYLWILGIKSADKSVRAKKSSSTASKPADTVTLATGNSFSVATGKNYKVSLEYENGLVSIIKVTD